MIADHVFDVIVIGGGLAGVNCALECFDIRLDTLLVESTPALGGQLPEVLHSVRNVAAGRFASGADLQRALHETAAILRDRVRLSDPVTAVDLEGRWLEAGGDRLRFRALVVAAGTSEQYLAAAPDGAFGGDITYQLENDPRHFSGSEAAVIGGADSAAKALLEVFTGEPKRVARSLHSYEWPFITVASTGAVAPCAPRV